MQLHADGDEAHGHQLYATQPSGDFGRFRTVAVGGSARTRARLDRALLRRFGEPPSNDDEEEGGAASARASDAQSAHDEDNKSHDGEAGHNEEGEEEEEENADEDEGDVGAALEDEGQVAEDERLVREDGSAAPLLDATAQAARLLYALSPRLAGPPGWRLAPAGGKLSTAAAAPASPTAGAEPPALEMLLVSHREGRTFLQLVAPEDVRRLRTARRPPQTAAARNP